ncbi:MAG TPA: AlkA N-terminal domain-containing protein [Actinomycetales bacterium]|nr:AlkA N-terminal domain-containing protein [Actinomycetales bacterium]
MKRLLAFLGAHAVPGVESWDGETYARTLALPHGPGVVRVAGDDVSVEADTRDTDEATARVRHLLGLDDDTSPAEGALAGDPHVGPLVARRPGLRRPGSADHAETLFRTVVGQQVSLAGASAAAARLVTAAGTRLERSSSGLTHLFPTPSQLAALDPESLPLPRARSRCVVAVARALADDPALIEDDAALLALPGIGPWTVDYTRFRTRRDPDVWLASDLAVRRQLEAMRIDPEAAVTWAPYRSTVMMHLWAEYLDGRR